MAKMKILIVDDHADTRLILSTRLRKHDYETVFASDGYQALSAARQHQPQVILLDLHLPGGDGYLVLERLKSIPALSVIPVVVISSDDPATAEPRAVSAGAAGYLHKPVQEDALLEAIQMVLSES